MCGCMCANMSSTKQSCRFVPSNYLYRLSHKTMAHYVAVKQSHSLWRCDSLTLTPEVASEDVGVLDISASTNWW